MSVVLLSIMIVKYCSASHVHIFHFISFSINLMLAIWMLGWPAGRSPLCIPLCSNRKNLCHLFDDVKRYLATAYETAECPALMPSTCRHTIYLYNAQFDDCIIKFSSQNQFDILHSHSIRTWKNQAISLSFRSISIINCDCTRSFLANIGWALRTIEHRIQTNDAKQKRF